MAGVTESHDVRDLIRDAIVGAFAERDDVVDIKRMPRVIWRNTAVLTATVAKACASPLESPVGSVVVRRNATLPEMAGVRSTEPRLVMRSVHEEAARFVARESCRGDADVRAASTSAPNDETASHERVASLLLGINVLTLGPSRPVHRPPTRDAACRRTGREPRRVSRRSVKCCAADDARLLDFPSIGYAGIATRPRAVESSSVRERHGANQASQSGARFGHIHSVIYQNGGI